MLSFLLHAAVVFAFVHFAAVQQTPLNQKHPFIQLSTTRIIWDLPKTAASAGGGGHAQLPAGRGELPRKAPRQFLPPTTRQSDHVPALPVEPTIAGLQEAPTAPNRAIGVPGGAIGPPSDGPGRGPGIGAGPGRDGIGDGDGPGIGGGRPGSQRSAPLLVYKIEPEFSEEARKARMEGIVILQGIVDESGRVQDIQVVRSLGLGLDEKAIEAVRKWRFKPGMSDGRPVRQRVSIEVNFHLL